MSGVFCDCNRKQNSEEYYYNNINKNNKKDYTVLFYKEML